MPKVDKNTVVVRGGSAYPAPLQVNASKLRARLGDAVGLTQFGVNFSTLPPGAQSALRHWHEQEDEFVYILFGQVVLVEDDGETVLGPGDAAGFKAGVANGHHLVNRSDQDATFLEIGSRMPSEKGHYPDDDLVAEKTPEGYVFTHKDGTPYA